MSDFDVYEASIADIHRAVAAGQATFEQVTQGYLDRIAAYDDHGPGLNALITLNSGALRQAREADAAFAATGETAGPLAGIPVVLKDNIESAEMVTTAGSKAFSSYVPVRDAPVAARLRAAGAIILAKTNLDEFSRASVGLSGAGGQTRNPYKLDCVPGGSSGGVGASVAASFAAAGIGTETGCSIRNPATNCSLVGVAPTRGLVPTAGIVPISFTQDRAGAIARTANDAARMMAAIAGYDARDQQSALGYRQAPADYLSGTLTASRLRGARLGVVRELFGTSPADQESAAIVNAAVGELSELGAVVLDEVPVQRWLDRLLPVLDPMYPSGDTALNTVLADARTNDWEQQTAMNSYLQGCGAAAPFPDLATLVESGAVLESTLGGLRESLGKGLRDEEYIERLLRISALRSAATNVMAELSLDALVFPMKTQPAWPIGTDASVSVRAASGNVFSSISGLPAVVTPAGYTAAGLPVSIEFMGAPFTEPALIGFAHHFETATAHRRPPASTPSLAA